MKAEIIIPEGWRRVTHGKARCDDWALDPVVQDTVSAWKWVPVARDDCVGDPVGNFHCVIRKAEAKP